MAPDAVDAVLRAAHGWDEQVELARLRRDRSTDAQRSEHWQRLAKYWQQRAETAERRLMAVGTA